MFSFPVSFLFGLVDGEKHFTALINFLQAGPLTYCLDNRRQFNKAWNIMKLFFSLVGSVGRHEPSATQPTIKLTTHIYAVPSLNYDTTTCRHPLFNLLVFYHAVANRELQSMDGRGGTRTFYSSQYVTLNMNYL